MKLKKAYYGSYNETIHKRKELICILLVFVVMIAIVVGIVVSVNIKNGQKQAVVTEIETAKEFSIPEYSGSVSVTVNNNVPFFEEKDFSLETFEHYSPLDNLGRCGVAMACIGLETMPTEERGSIGMIKPSGWKTIRYDDLIEDRYLYNRCHLIAYMLAGENANEKNLITGTRYFNVSGMLPYESETANYIRKTSNHVLYRVTPCFLGDNLVATGVLMEAQSVEDGGRGLQFNVFIFNVQPGIQIDYRTGDSERTTK